MSGWGGILAAMAQGLGTGIVKNVEQGWKNEETDKLLDWKSNESEKQRIFDNEQNEKKFKHEIELTQLEGQNRIRAAIAAHGFGNDKKDVAQKNYERAVQTIGIYDQDLARLNELRKDTTDKNQIDYLDKRIKYTKEQKDRFMSLPETISSIKGAGEIGTATYVSFGGNVDLLNPRPTAPENKPVIAPTQRNMVDMNNLSAQEVAQLAKQKQEEQSRMSFVKASDEAKEWAAKRNQYTPSTFIPRPF